MAPPFSSEQFFAVFAQYNETVWPIQIVFVLCAVGSIAAVFLRPSSAKWVLGFLAMLWFWMGVAYHWLFFSRINPIAVVFGGAFVIEGALLLWYAWRTADLQFQPLLNTPGFLGGALVAYGLIVYPLLGLILGHRYPMQPTFGLPCPTTIFTVGVLLWVRGRVPWPVLVVPAAWSIVGMSAVRFFGVVEDAMLPVAGLIGGALLLWRNRQLPEERGNSAGRSAI